jgi:hypothetical protein
MGFLAVVSAMLRREARMTSAKARVCETEPHELVRSFLRDIDAATACINILELATLRYDHERMTSAIQDLHAIWELAEAAIANLEAASGAAELFARDALRHSRESATGPVRRAVDFLRYQNALGVSTTTPASKCN